MSLSSNEKMQNLVKWGSCGGYVIHFCNYGTPPNISRTVEARNFKFGKERTAVSSNKKNAKLGQKGSCGGHVTHFFNFGTP